MVTSGRGSNLNPVSSGPRVKFLLYHVCSVVRILLYLIWYSLKPSKYYYYSHFTGEETGADGVYVWLVWGIWEISGGRLL